MSQPPIVDEPGVGRLQIWPLHREGHPMPADPATASASTITSGL